MLHYDDREVAAGYAAAHHHTDASGRFFRSRISLSAQVLVSASGELLDVGAGPGMLARELLDTRPGSFAITAVDLSPSMVREFVQRNPDAQGAVVGQIEELPFSSGGFDVVVATGVLEYSNLPRAISELTRVVKTGGIVVVSMLNPKSPYRFYQVYMRRSLLRLMGRLDALRGVPQARRHHTGGSPARAYRSAHLRAVLAAAGLEVLHTQYFDIASHVPMVDKLLASFSNRYRDDIRTSSSARRRELLATGYIIVARR